MADTERYYHVRTAEGAETKVRADRHVERPGRLAKGLELYLGEEKVADFIAAVSWHISDEPTTMGGKKW